MVYGYCPRILVSPNKSHGTHFCSRFATHAKCRVDLRQLCYAGLKMRHHVPGMCRNGAPLPPPQVSSTRCFVDLQPTYDVLFLRRPGALTPCAEPTPCVLTPPMRLHSAVLGCNFGNSLRLGTLGARPPPPPHQVSAKESKVEKHEPKSKKRYCNSWRPKSVRAL